MRISKPISEHLALVQPRDKSGYPSKTFLDKSLPNMIEVIEISDSNGRIIEETWLPKAQAVHRQLRPQLPEDYTEKMRRVFSAGGRMAVGLIGGEVAGVAVYRIYENTASGVHMYVDDLVTTEEHRSKGVGKALIDHLQALAKQQGCEVLTLDSATHRLGAHKFYFREGFSIVAFHFAKYFRGKK